MDLRSLIHAPPPASITGALKKLPPPLRLAALRDTLSVCAPSETEVFALELITLCNTHTQTVHQIGVRPIDRILESLHRRAAARQAALARQAAAVLIRSWHRLPAQCRALALASDGVGWTEIARACVGDETAEALAAFIDSIDTPAALPVAVRLLETPDRDAADAAEAFLLRQTARFLPTPRPDRPRRLNNAETPGPSPTLDELTRALSTALERYEQHERSGPALAALMLLDRPETTAKEDPLAPIRAIIDDERHPAFPVIRRLLKRDDAPAVRRIAWRLLRDHPLAMAALERVARSGDTRRHDALLELAHLILNPERAALTGHLATSPAPRPGARRPITDSALPQTTRGLSLPARRGLPRLLRTLPAHPALTAAVHLESLTDPDDHTRLMHARFTDGPELADFCFDPSPTVAHTAMIRWSSVGTTGHASSLSDHRARLARKLARHPQPAIRSLARSETTGELLDTTSPAGRARLIAMRSKDRVALSTQLKQRAAAGDTEDRVAAIRTARRLGLLTGWLDTLAALIDEPADRADRRAAATAAAALGDLPGPEADPVLDRALHHRDPRVRANAVESIDRRTRGREKHRFVELKSSAEHRSRANALRALARDEKGGADLDNTFPDLEAMLTDDRPPHRLAGVWLAERLLCSVPAWRGPWQSLAGRVAAIARQESDMHTRARAVRCSRRLLGQIAAPEKPAPDAAADRTRDRLNQYAAAYSGENP